MEHLFRHHSEINETAAPMFQRRMAASAGHTLDDADKRTPHDKLAELRLLERLTQTLGTRASLRLFEHADHSFHVPVRPGRNDHEVMRHMLDDFATWVETLL
jgi:hypothetical protein